MAFIYFDYKINGKIYTKHVGNPSTFLKYHPEATITGITAELPAGYLISDAVKECKEMAKECNIPVRFEANGIEVTVDRFSPDDLFEDINFV